MNQRDLTRRDCFLVLGGTGALHAQENSAESLDFLHGLFQYENVRRMLPEYLAREAQAQVAARKNSVNPRTLDAIARRRQYVRERILRAIDGLPEKTALNPKTVGTLERQGYRIDKVIFESQPNFYVTANLYVPSAHDPPFPCVLFPLGHELGGKAHGTWQQLLGTLARMGFLCLAWDPVGQGERVQIYDPDLQGSKLRGSTTEHTMLGIQCLLTGQHIARYTISDGIRALDYLLSRKEADPERVICTGNSGGGTHTAYLAAVDDRIKVAAPSCYITSWHWMLKTLGPQDAEQTFPGWLGDGLDYPDFIYAFAPKPYLILSAIRDFFPIDGARETFAEARELYAAVGEASKLSFFEADDGHGYTLSRRMAAYEWFARWQHPSGAVPTTEATIAPEASQTLDCTPTGQVFTSLGGETVFTLNRARAHQLARNRARLSGAADLKAYQERIRRAAIARSGYKQATGPPPAVIPYGKIMKTGYVIEKLVYDSQTGIQIPSLLYMPTTGAARHPAVVLVDGVGKSAAKAAAEQFASAGTAVLAVDLRGMGETKPAADLNDTESYRYFGDYEDAMTAIMLNRTLVAMRAGDVLRGIDLLASRSDVDASRISGIGRNSGTLPLLFAAVFDVRLRAISLEQMLASYEAVTSNGMHRLVFEHIVPGALIDFDLPDLVAALAPRRVWITGPQSAVGVPLARTTIEGIYRPATDAFRFAGREGALRLNLPMPDDQAASDYYRELLQPV
jgi:cephalosporin-C deacetylase-like acetyl esterase